MLSSGAPVRSADEQRFHTGVHSHCGGGHGKSKLHWDWRRRCWSWRGFRRVPSAQQFTGGLTRRGTCDANGIIPGVTVTLTNEGTAITREAATNEQGLIQLLGGDAGHLHGEGGAAGIQDATRTKASGSGPRCSSRSMSLLEVGQIEESVTVTGSVAADRDVERLGLASRWVASSLESLPAPGRAAFLIAITVPTVNPVGDPQFNRQQDQTNASLISLGGGGVRANNYTGRRRADHRPDRPRRPSTRSIEAIDEVKVQVAHLRRRHGTHRRRRVQHDRQDGNQPVSRHRLLPVPSGMGPVGELFQCRGGPDQGAVWSGQRALSHLWRRCRRPDLEEPHLLLDLSRGLSLHDDTEPPGDTGRARASARGDFSTSTIGGQPVRIFNPWCRSGAASAQCPATGTGSLATGGEFTGGDHPAHASSGQPGRLQSPRRLPDGGHTRQPDWAQRGQPGQRQHAPAASRDRG